MSILRRINQAIKGNLDDMLDKLQDPAKEVEQLIIEMRDGLRGARNEVVSATGDAKRQQQRIAELEGEVARWQARAEQAVQAGGDDLARQALQQRIAQATELARAQEAHAGQQSYVAELKASLEALERRLQEVELRKETTKQRARAAKKGDARLEGAAPFDALDRLEARLDAKDEVADLTETAASKEATLEAKIARLQREGGSEIDDELAKLKAQLDRGK